MKQAELSFFSEPQGLGTRVEKKASAKKNKIAQEEADFSSSVAAKPQLFTVTELTRRITSLLERNIGEVWIEGEISNYRRQASGHHYFTLKDAGAQISCVLFARSAASLPSSVRLADGVAVQIQGNVTVYQPRGQYQLMVRLIQPRGIGLLQAKFEALKQKLAAEGLFETERKRPLPRFPQRIGVVTSPTGAAIADFLNVLHRRHPGLEVVIAPVRVQGRGAAEEIALAIKNFSSLSPDIGVVDVIVVARGGGSLEDLWEFNEEIVARAIVASSIPVMSAVGHEIDYTICDFAADIRVPTPSAAAELLAADSVNLLENVSLLIKRLQREVFLQCSHFRHRWEQVSASALFREPERRCWELQQHLDYSVRVLETTTRHRWEQAMASWKTAASELRRYHPELLFQRAHHDVGMLERELNQKLLHQQQRTQAQYERLRSSLAALSPEGTLARGFTITRNQEGKIISSITQASSKSVISTQFRDGMITSILE